MSDRIVATETVTVRVGDADLRLRGGELYLLEEDVRDRLIDEQVAYPEDEPPTCDECGAWFEGAGAWSGLSRHRANHDGVEYSWDPADGDPLPLDGDHPEVAALRERTIPDQYDDAGLLEQRGLKQMCHDLGVSEDEVVATGASGPVKDDYIRHILRARGRHGFYATADGED